MVSPSIDLVGGEGTVKTQRTPFTDVVRGADPDAGALGPEAAVVLRRLSFTGVMGSGGAGVDVVDGDAMQALLPNFRVRAPVPVDPQAHPHSSGLSTTTGGDAGAGSFRNAGALQTSRASQVGSFGNAGALHTSRVSSVGLSRVSQVGSMTEADIRAIAGNGYDNNDSMGDAMPMWLAYLRFKHYLHIFMIIYEVSTLNSKP
jgi:hypothetical protein